MFYCPDCHAEIPADTTSCPVCGSFIIPQSGNATDSEADRHQEQQPPVLQQPATNPDVVEHTRPQSSATEEATARIPDEPVDDPYGEAVPYQQSGIIDEHSAISQPASDTEFSAIPVAPEPFQNPTPIVQRRSGLQKPLLVLYTLFLVAGVLLALYQFAIFPLQLHSQATAIAQSVATSEAQTSTQLGQSAQNLYSRETGKKPVINDSLSDAKNSTIFSADQQAQSGCNFTAGAYHLQTTTSQAEAVCIANAPIRNGFIFQVQQTFAQGDTHTTGGLLFNIQSDNQADFEATAFTISRGGIFALTTGGNVIASTLFAYGSSPAIHTGQGQSNTLTIIAYQNHIYAYINKQFVTSVVDAALAPGLIGLEAFDPDTQVDTAFSNMQIWQFT